MVRFNYRFRIAAGAILFAMLGAGLFMRAAWGPDYISYLKWAYIALSGDMFSVGGKVIAPSGVPFSFYNHGAGYLLSIPSVIMQLFSGASCAGVSIFSGRIISVLFWVVFSALLYEISGKRRLLTLFGIGVSFLATHLGYYSVRHGSESFLYTFLAIALYLAVSKAPVSVFRSIAAGCACGMCVVIRTESLLYVVPLLLYFIWRVLHVSERWQGKSLLASSLAVPILLALSQVCFVNAVMTGSPLTAPYSFGDGTFRSFDLLDPEIGALLFHPWHGLLVYHPFYLVLFGSVLYGSFLLNESRVRLLMRFVALLFAVNVYVDASWFCWWFGTGTFGSRTFGMSAVFMVPAFLLILRMTLDSGRSILPAMLVAFLCSLWSFLLMVQGHTNFASFGEMACAIASVLSCLPVLVSIALAATAGLLFSARLKGRDVVDTISGHDHSPVEKFIVSFLLALSLFWLTQRSYPDGSLQEWHWLIFSVAVVGIVYLCWLAQFPDWFPKALDVSVRYSVIVVFVLIYIMFTVMSIRTTIALSRTDKLESGKGKIIRSFDPDEVMDAMREYRMVSGFDDKKTKLREFIQKECPEYHE